MNREQGQALVAWAVASNEDDARFWHEFAEAASDASDRARYLALESRALKRSERLTAMVDRLPVQGTSGRAH